MPKTSEELRIKCIGAKATEAEYAALRKTAMEHGLSISAMVIEILVTWLIKAGKLPRSCRKRSRPNAAPGLTKKTPDG